VKVLAHEDPRALDRRVEPRMFTERLDSRQQEVGRIGQLDALARLERLLVRLAVAVK
jgi:hypothetical protein